MIMSSAFTNMHTVASYMLHESINFRSSVVFYCFRVSSEEVSRALGHVFRHMCLGHVTLNS